MIVKIIQKLFSVLIGNIDEKTKKELTDKFNILLKEAVKSASKTYLEGLTKNN